MEGLRNYICFGNCSEAPIKTVANARRPVIWRASEIIYASKTVWNNMVVEKRKPVAVLAQVLKMSAQQELLRKAWKGGRRGTLSAMSESKAWAIRECWQAESKGDYGLNTFVAKRLKKVGVYLFYTCSQTRSCTRLCL